MRIVSLLPAATEILLALGLGDEIVGLTDLCPLPPGDRIEGVARVARRPAGAPDRPIAPRGHPGGALLLELDVAALADADPDLVVGSDLRLVCAAGTRELRALASELDEDVSILGVDAVSVEGVINAVQSIGAMTEAEDAAMDVVIGLRERLQAVEAIVVGRQDRGFQPPRVAALGWLEEPFGTGWWIPEQVRLAGGWELIGHEGARSAPTGWSQIRDLDPEVIVLMPEGHDLADVVRAWEATPRPEGWSDLRAVTGRRVFAVDAAAYFTHAGPRIVDGIEVLSELVDPIAFDGMSPPESWVRVE